MQVDPEVVGLTAFEISAELAAGDPPIMVRDHEAIDLGFFFLDPCNVNEKQAEMVISAIRTLVELPQEKKKLIKSRYPQRPNQADILARKLKGWIPEQ